MADPGRGDPREQIFLVFETLEQELDAMVKPENPTDMDPGAVPEIPRGDVTGGPSSNRAVVVKTEDDSGSAPAPHESGEDINRALGSFKEEMMAFLRREFQKLNESQKPPQQSENTAGSSTEQLSLAELHDKISVMRADRMAVQRTHHEYVASIQAEKGDLKRELDTAKTTSTQVHEQHTKSVKGLQEKLATAQVNIKTLEGNLSSARRKDLQAASLTDPPGTGGLPKLLLEHTKAIHDREAQAQWNALESEVSNIVRTFLTHRIAWYRLNRGARELMTTVTPHYDEAEAWDPNRAEDWSDHWRIAMMKGCIWRVIHEKVFDSSSEFWAGDEGTHLDHLLNRLYKCHKNDPDALYHFNKIRVSLIPYIKPSTDEAARDKALRATADHVTEEFYRLIQTGTFRHGREDPTPFTLALTRVLRAAMRVRDVFVRSPANWMIVFPKPLGRGRRVDRRTMEVTDPVPLCEGVAGHRSRRGAGGTSSTAAGGGVGGSALPDSRGVTPQFRSHRRCTATSPTIEQTLVPREGDGPQDGDTDVWVVAVVTPALVRYGGTDGQWELAEGKGVAIVKAKVVCLPILPESSDDEEGGDKDGGGKDGGGKDRGGKDRGDKDGGGNGGGSKGNDNSGSNASGSKNKPKDANKETDEAGSSKTADKETFSADQPRHNKDKGRAGNKGKGRDNDKGETQNAKDTASKTTARGDSTKKRKKSSDLFVNGPPPSPEPVRKRIKSEPSPELETPNEVVPLPDPRPDPPRAPTSGGTGKKCPAPTPKSPRQAPKPAKKTPEPAKTAPTGSAVLTPAATASVPSRTTSSGSTPSEEEMAAKQERIRQRRLTRDRAAPPIVIDDD